MPLHPPIEPYERGFLPVDEIHTLYYEVSGNPDGVPILFLHGGPGSKTESHHRQFFDPNYYKIILTHRLKEIRPGIW
jgi:proline iminopeptidase